MALIEYDLFKGKVDKVQLAIERFQEFEPEEGYYLAFSGGKDSIVLKRLAEMAGVKFEAHYNLTTIDPPELINFIRQYHSDVPFTRPEKPLIECMVDNKGFPPLRTVRWCCELYKEKSGVGRLISTGVRKEESIKRSKRKMIETCYKDSSKRYLHPIIDWSTADVWEFIRKEKIPYCSLYDEGFKRLGCILCPMAGVNKLREAERWPKIAAAWERGIIRLFEKRKAEGNPFSSWKNGREMYLWWLYDLEADDPDQTVIFE